MELKELQKMYRITFDSGEGKEVLADLKSAYYHRSSFTKDPYEYLDTEKRENFFETTVTEYSQSSAVTGWDDF